MAVIDRRPDSGEDRGGDHGVNASLAAVDRAVAQGADIVDIGEAVARPGGGAGAADDTRDVVLFIELVRARHPELLISLDAGPLEAVRPALEAGADIVNGVWAPGDPMLAEVVAGHACAVVCRRPRCLFTGSGPDRIDCTEVVRELGDDLVAAAERLVGLGIARETILIDPSCACGEGLGHGLALMRHCAELTSTGWPVLLTLAAGDFAAPVPSTVVDRRIDGLLAATAIAAWAGVRVFRARQVRETRRALEMVASIAGTRPPARAMRGLA